MAVAVRPAGPRGDIGDRQKIGAGDPDDRHPRKALERGDGGADSLPGRIPAGAGMTGRVRP